MVTDLGEGWNAQIAKLTSPRCGLSKNCQAFQGFLASSHEGVNLIWHRVALGHINPPIASTN